MAVKDRLFVLGFDYPDPDFAPRRFYCKDCVTVEGLLALFPERASNIELVRVPWPRPRAAVAAALGEDNQNLPSLAFAEGGFVNEIEALLAALHTRHGFPERHP
ncbi:DUF3088 family protein [Novosphingobium sp. P6W]|uniref:DUF3088 family protein n=1 Tax=Novosphingobium sp. P6W TaxID=1609758 RepID=UPI0005C3216A|nr:DUF3088 family protein [Novosphingobium sp. P6W]AXB77948.1 DUF3088 family protein [Novosphingobium sp. P6W]KIS32880.1 hypothetical protein TQ38_10675 [Novosphingobium sp. P6W]